jgi:hypothetical protein
MDSEGRLVYASDKSIKEMVGLWRDEVKRMLKNVSVNHSRVTILDPM